MPLLIYSIIFAILVPISWPCARTQPNFVTTVRPTKTTKIPATTTKSPPATTTKSPPATTTKSPPATACSSRCPATLPPNIPPPGGSNCKLYIANLPGWHTGFCADMAELGLNKYAYKGECHAYCNHSSIGGLVYMLTGDQVFVIKLACTADGQWAHSINTDGGQHRGPYNPLPADAKLFCGANVS